MMLPKNLSISIKMALSIIILQLIALYLMTAFLIYDALATNKKSFAGVITDSQAQIVLDAATYDKNNKLTLNMTPEVEAFLSNSGAWVIVSDNLGQVLRYGNAPDHYEKITEIINKFGRSVIRSTSGNNQLSMKLVLKSVGSNTIRVMVGGVPTYEVGELFFMLAKVLSIKIFMPLALATIILTPYITRRILSGLSSAANDAKHINENDRYARIREKGIPKEVMPLVKAVNGALQRLSDGYEERDRFLSSAAHELRAPIAIIQARLNLITELETKKILSNDVARLSNLAESLLDLQRIGQLMCCLNVVDLKKTLKLVISDYSPLIIAFGYEIDFFPCPEDVHVMGDEASLSRVIINILQNAISYGGGKGLISITLSRTGYITIQDEGPGIPVNERERIFEPFQRVIPSSQGTGLGLHLVKEIVHMHKGTVVASQGNKRGALFEIHLPIICQS